MTDLSGQIIGNYRVEALLGAGGMGQVYRARHMHLNRIAAIKVMGAAVAADAGFQARFRQEATAMNELRHPHIVELYDFGEQQGYFYLIMEYVPDGTLRTLLSAGRIPLAQGVDLICQAAAGLAYAHSRGVIHRDVKPGNLLLLRRADGYTLKIADFGLARMTESPDMTTVGTVIGSPQYMSPEQCLGAPLDRRTDIYSLGVVLYEVVTGLLVFQGGTDEVKRKHVYTQPPAPSSVNPALPAEIEAVILRSLAKRPENRFADADAFRLALERALKGETGPFAAATPTAIVGTPDRVPLVRALDQAGGEVASVVLTASGLTIGRTSQCNLVLDAADVSRQHLQIAWDGVKARVTDLGSSNGTLLGKIRIPARTAQDWTPDQELQVGPYRLALTLPVAAPETAPADATLIQPPTAIQPHHGETELALAVVPPELDVEPGYEAVTQVTVANYSSIVDHIQLATEGVPRAWIADMPQSIQLMPGESREAPLKFRPPREPGSRAGAHSVTVRALSRNAPQQAVEAPLIVRLAEFRQLTCELRPQRRRSIGAGNFSIRAVNQGNAAATLAFDARDPEDACYFEYHPARLAVGPGEEQTATLTVRLRADAPGQTRNIRFSLTARHEGDSQPLPPMNGEWESVPFELQLALQRLEGASGRFRVELTNPGTVDTAVILAASSSSAAWEARLDTERMEIPAAQGRSVHVSLHRREQGVDGRTLTLNVTASAVDLPESRRNAAIEWTPPAPIAPSPPTAQAQSCPRCGGAVRAGQVYCSTCGVELRGAPHAVIVAPAEEARKGQVAPDLVAHPVMPKPVVAQRRIGSWFWLGLLLTDIIGNGLGIALYLAIMLFLQLPGDGIEAYALLTVWFGFFWWCHWLLLLRRVPAPGGRAFVNTLTMALIIGITVAVGWLTEDVTITILAFGISALARLVIRTVQLRNASLLLPDAR